MQSTGLSHNELKSVLFSHIRDRGVLKTLKGTLRKELLQAIPSNELVVMNNNPSEKMTMVPSSRPAAATASSSPTDFLCESLIEGYLRHKDLAASRTVFLGESGLDSQTDFQNQLKADNDLCTLLGLPSIGTNNEISNETCVLTNLIRAHLKQNNKYSAFAAKQATTEVGIQCNRTSTAPTNQLSFRDPNSFESIEYKLSLVEQSFIHSNQVCEQNSRLQSEVNFSKLQQRIRDESMREAKHLLSKWKETEETLIRRDEKLKAEERIQQKLREFQQMEKKLREEVDNEKTKAELQIRRASQELLRLEEDRNDLKKAVYLREQLKLADEREMESLRNQLREAQHRSANLEAQLEHVQRQAELQKISELRRLDLKEREINDLLAQLHEQHDKVSQVRFESRALAEECAHSLDAAARAATLKRQQAAKEVIAGGGFMQQQLIPASAAVTPAQQQRKPASSASTSQQQQQQHSSVSRQPKKQVFTAKTPSTSTSRSSRGNSEPQPQPVSILKKTTETTTTTTTAAAKKSPSPVSPQPKKQQQQTFNADEQQQQESPQTNKLLDELVNSSSTANNILPPVSPLPAVQKQKSASPTASSSTSSDDFETDSDDGNEKQKQEEKDAAAAEAAKKLREEAELKEQQQQREAQAAVEAEKQKQQQLQKWKEEQETIFKKRFAEEVFDPETSGRNGVSQTESTDFATLRHQEETTRTRIKKFEDSKNVRKFVQECEKSYDTMRKEIVELEEKEWKNVMWSQNHEYTLLKARTAKQDEEVFVPPPTVLKRDSDDSDYDSDKNVNIFGKGSDDDEDW